MAFLIDFRFIPFSEKTRLQFDYFMEGFSVFIKLTYQQIRNIFIGVQIRTVSRSTDGLDVKIQQPNSIHVSYMYHG